MCERDSLTQVYQWSLKTKYAHTHDEYELETINRAGTGDVRGRDCGAGADHEGHE